MVAEGLVAASGSPSNPPHSTSLSLSLSLSLYRVLDFLACSLATKRSSRLVVAAGQRHDGSLPCAF